jgi:hypothetical protein
MSISQNIEIHIIQVFNTAKSLCTLRCFFYYKKLLASVDSKFDIHNESSCYNYQLAPVF